MDFKALLHREDENGNRLAVAPDGFLTLHLKGDRPKGIGQLFTTQEGRVCYDKEVKEANRFRKTNAWGLNWAILEALPTEAVLRLRGDQGQTYYITAGDAKLKGDFLWFKTQGFERQIFVPVSAFEVRA